MAWVDLVDAAHELMPRRWKKWVSTVLLIALFVFPNQVRDAMLWYARERANQLLEQFLPVITRSLQPGVAQTNSD